MMRAFPEVGTTGREDWLAIYLFSPAKLVVISLIVISRGQALHPSNLVFVINGIAFAMG